MQISPRNLLNVAYVLLIHVQVSLLEFITPNSRTSGWVNKSTLEALRRYKQDFITTWHIGLQLPWCTVRDRLAPANYWKSDCQGLTHESAN